MIKYNSTSRSKSDLRASSPYQAQLITFRFIFNIITLVLADVTSLGFSWTFAAKLNKLYSPIPSVLVWWEFWGLPSLFWLFSCVSVLLFFVFGLYTPKRAWKNYILSAQVISISYLVSLITLYVYDPKLDLPRSLFFSAWFFSLILIVLLRLFSTIFLQLLDTKQPQVRAFIVAPAHRIFYLSNLLQTKSNYIVVGAAFSSAIETDLTIQRILEANVNEVLVEGIPSSDLASNLYWKLRRSGITLRLIPSSVEVLHRRGISEIFAGMPTLRSAPTMFIGFDFLVKRSIDIIISLIVLVFLCPFLFLISILIKLSSPGPIIYSQKRVGLHGKVFNMLKFRTMINNAEQLQRKLERQNEVKDGVLFKIKHDPRVTKIGALLRKTSIDELPQLINVLAGQMSLVGPRPLPIRDVERFNSWHHIRHQVLPGITGLWQISGRSQLDDFDQAARLDLYYIDNWSLNLDFEILVETIRIVLISKGAY